MHSGHEESEVRPGNQAPAAQRSVRHTAAAKFRLGKGAGEEGDEGGALPAPDGCLVPTLPGWQKNPLRVRETRALPCSTPTDGSVHFATRQTTGSINARLPKRNRNKCNFEFCMLMMSMNWQKCFKMCLNCRRLFRSALADGNEPAEGARTGATGQPTPIARTF